MGEGLIAKVIEEIDGSQQSGEPQGKSLMSCAEDDAMRSRSCRGEGIALLQGQLMSKPDASAACKPLDIQGDIVTGPRDYGADISGEGSMLPTL